MAVAPANPLLTTVPKALHLGWTMATLYNIPERGGTAAVRHLPTAHEVDDDKRRDVELRRLTCLLTDLTQAGVGSLADASTAAATISTTWAGAIPGQGGLSTLTTELEDLNLQLIEGLASAADEIEMAYELGRSLRDTSSPPPLRGGASSDDDLRQAFIAVLGSERISTIQQWLQTVAPYLPSHAARIVSVSLGRWSETVGASLDDSRPGKLKGATPQAFSATMQSYLLRQGEVWLHLLTGTETTQGLLGPEGYVAAGELALRRTTRIVTGVLRRYWVALVILAGGLAVVLSLSGVYLGGAAKVWTDIAAIAGTFGVTANGVGSAMTRMAKTAEVSIFGLEAEDVMAWSITALPPVRLNFTGVRALRRAGIAPSRRLSFAAPRR